MAGEDEIVALGEDQEDDAFSSLAGTIKAKFQTAENARQFDEKRWLRAYRNYRGIYGNDMAFTESEKSKVFVKITKTKVMAAYGQIIEVLFSTGKFPVGVQPTSVPEGIAEYAHVSKSKNPETQVPESPYGFPGDGNDLEPGTVINNILGGLKEEYQDADFVKGEAKDSRSEPQISPAEMAAANMEKLIHDQLESSSAISVMRHSLFEMALLGTGIIKGPFSYDKVQHYWNKDETTGETSYDPKTKLVPRIEAVSCWDFYPDPDAVTIEDADYVIQRHNYTKSQVRDLTNRPYFRNEAIRECLAMGANYEARGYESSLLDRETTDEFDKNRYEILEFWGYLDRELATQAGLEIDDDIIDDLDEVQVNCWVCNGKILRLVVNPFTPARIPYLVSPYEINPYQFFGVGIPENMDDSQTIMNGHARMAIDNLALAGNLVFDIDETMLVPGQDMKVHPGKIFRRQSGMPGQALHGLKFPNTSNENLMMFDRFRQLADESTGIPSYSHGTTGVQSTTRTAAGMSMLMGAAALNVKTVVKNIDDYLLRPLGESMFAWNMQFNEDSPEIRGDVEIKARGTSSLMQKEVRSQRLMTFLQAASNQNLAPFVRWHTVLSEIAKSLDIEPEKLINDPERAAIFAKIMGMANGTTGNQGNNQQSGMDEGGENVGGANPQDPTGSGGGNIGTGNVPQPGETGFSSPVTGTTGAT
tara:strand:+ start:476 stop:2578 length:2103 start_codon:yes stop_codon:yes gene_type:complete